MSGMEQFKPYVAVSQKGLVARYFDTEAEALQYAKARAEENFVSLAVARVIRTVDPSGKIWERERIESAATDVQTLGAANG